MKVLSYIVLALFLIVGGLAATFYVKSKTQGAQITVLENDLDAAKKSLSDVKKSVRLSDDIIKGLSSTLSVINERGSVINERVITLERNNEEIRDLLATPLPSGGCLLDNSCSNLPDAKPSPPAASRKATHP